VDLARKPAFVEELLERITEIQVRLAQRFAALGVDGGYFGDDYGAQKHLLFSPRTWRELFKPRLARMFAVFRETGVPVILHSDGDIAEIVPDLVEIGLTTLNPVQPEVLDHAWLKRTFGDRVSFYGGVSTQTVLPQGTPAEVRSAVETCVQTLAADGSGLVVAPSHRLTADMPMENVDALLAAFAALGEGV
jgi:uroporphyrinogen decarboxylase